MPPPAPDRSRPWAAWRWRIVKTTEFLRFKTELTAILHKVTNGNLNKVILAAYHGTSGGTGPEATQIVVKDLSRTLSNSTDATIVEDYSALGPMTNLEFGPRIEANSAAAIVELVGRTVDPTLDDRVVPYVSFMELPMVGGDRELHDRLVAQVVQARNCLDVECWTGTVASNEAGTSRVGNIGIVQVDLSRQLDPQLDVRPLIARHWAEQLSAVHEEAAGDRESVRIKLHMHESPLGRTPLDSILAAAEEGEATEKLIAQLLAQSAQYAIGVHAHLSSGTRLDLTNFSSTMAARPNGIAQLRERLSMERACLAAADDELGGRMEEHDFLAAEVDAGIQETKSLIRTLQGRGVGTYLLGSLTSIAHKRRAPGERGRSIATDFR